MELKEARHTAGFLQRLVDMIGGYSLTLSATDNAGIYEAIIVLCDRLTELEAQRDKLLEVCKELTIESANNITNEGKDGIGANKVNIQLIERITGKIWQEI